MHPGPRTSSDPHTARLQLLSLTGALAPAAAPLLSLPPACRHLCSTLACTGGADPTAPPSRHTQLDPKTPDIFQQPPASMGVGLQRKHQVYLYALSMCGRSDNPEEARMLQQVPQGLGFGA